MKQAAINSFKECISSKLRQHSSQRTLVATAAPLASKMDAAHEFYHEFKEELGTLIEDTQVTYPVTNTIFLLHELEKEVNSYFGIVRDYAEDKTS